MINICLLIQFCFSVGNTSISHENKYKTAFDYLVNSTEVQKKIELTFKRHKVNTYIPTVSSLIKYADYAPFCSKPSDTCLLELTNEEKDLFEFEAKYYFRSFTDSTIKGINSPAGADLILYFSKPVKNFLPAMIFLRSQISGGLKGGTGFKLVFVFDSSNKIKSVLSTEVILM